MFMEFRGALAESYVAQQLVAANTGIFTTGEAPGAGPRPTS